MTDPGYDFFASGTGAGSGATPAIPGGQQPTSAHGTTPAVNQFGTPLAPLTNQFGAPSAPAAVPVAPASGYQPGRVNQFGTPIDVQAAPVGPYAAPGVAAAAIATPGLVSTWDPAARAGSRAAARQGSSASVGASRPGTVLAAGILSIINGGLILIGVVLAWLALAALSSAVSQSGVVVSSGATASVDAVLFVFLAVGVAWVSLGTGVVLGKRGAVKVLRVLVFLGTLLAIIMVAGNQSLDRIVTLALDLVMIYLLWNKDASEWLSAP
jgi:hypothetical protein